ncbi:DNA-binding protein [Nonlabens sp. MIC269]|uniref:PUR family DNA/RNA-binding protein n=1 Tax=Nonlabens TaxID=363408 RepID=UPI00071FDCB9|nr:MULTISPECIES: PUR family DNA/RNA-binding protein [Nonlabens]ALM21545.1 DNA-binding protein [Nonlabens sp. MIC269]MEE2800899.1 PUR family DNA/RNA-binding protein [Bacteroidota bacterium]PQJ14236.1 DNA-binding protein [Nonlabens tegetincola]
MSDRDYKEQEDIFSKVVRAGRRTYFFDVRSTKADDYYLTITESKKFTNDDGSYHFKKHKIYLYKEDFAEFTETLNEVTNFIVKEKGDEVISERHQSDYKKEDVVAAHDNAAEPNHPASFTNVEFDDI